MWELFICIGVSWAGCAANIVTAYPNEDSCYRALNSMKTGDQQFNESDKKRNTVAYCRPQQPKK